MAIIVCAFWPVNANDCMSSKESISIDVGGGSKKKIEESLTNNRAWESVSSPNII